MAYEMDAGAQSRLHGFFSAMGRALKNKTRMASFATHAMGLFSSLERAPSCNGCRVARSVTALAPRPALRECSDSSC
jgi:hypothetical protein